MSREVVFDIETIGDIQDMSSMKLTVVSIYEYENDSYHSFEEHELGALWPIFERAERIIGFNSEHFDIPILNRYYTGDLLKFPSLDLLKIVKEVTGRRYKLNDLVKATLQMEKSADGLQAMEWFKEGKLDLIKQYCEQDVKVTKELYDFGRQNKMIYYPTLTGEILPIPVNFEPTAVSGGTSGSGGGAGSSGINLTLPF